MARKDFIAFCRYYKGEKANPFTKRDDTRAMFWNYELKWVDFNENGENILTGAIDDYARVGLSMFNVGDGVPVSLKALLFNRYCHWNSGASYECVDGFKDFYKKKYLRS